MNKFKRNYFYNITRGRRIIEKMVEFDKELPIKNIIERNEVIYNQDKSREYEKECVKNAYYIAAEGIEFIYKDVKNKGDKDE